MLAYSTITVPATLAIPHVITMKSSPRVSLARYGRTRSGASTMPTNTFAAVESPTAPPTPSVFSRSRDIAFTSHGRTRQ
jgi:hypothetical protein